MKISTVVMMLLLVALVFAIVGSVSSDIETYYPNKSINPDLGEDYDYSNEINKSVSGIRNDFKDISDPDTGWLTKLTSVGTAVPNAMIAVVKTLFKSMHYGIIIFSNVGSKLGIPGGIVSIGVVGIIVAVVFALIAFWRRYKA